MSQAKVILFERFTHKTGTQNLLKVKPLLHILRYTTDLDHSDLDNLNNDNSNNEGSINNVLEILNDINDKNQITLTKTNNNQNNLENLINSRLTSIEERCNSDKLETKMNSIDEKLNWIMNHLSMNEDK